METSFISTCVSPRTLRLRRLKKNAERSGSSVKQMLATSFGQPFSTKNTMMEKSSLMARV